MRIESNKFRAAGLAAIGFAAIGGFGAASAATSESARYTHPACEGANAVCGVIVYGVATSSYYVSSAEIKARGDQPDSTETHPACAGTEKKLTKDIAPTNYDTFVLPASCAYKLKISIKAGNKKDINLFLTPGCKLVTQTDGTAISNNWKSVEVSTLSTQVPTVNGKPVDQSGHVCGKQSKSGT